MIIVGGGIAGLAAAYELHRRGVAFQLLEAGPRPGGVILSERRDGYTIDAGPDALLTQKPDAIRLCEELGLGPRLVPTNPPRLAFIQRGGRLHPLPASSVLGIPTRLGPFVRTRLFTWPGKLRMGGELFVPPRRDPADESIGAFMRRRFGAEAAIYLAEPLLAGIHAGDVDRLSVQALFPRLVEAERRHGSLMRAFRRERAAAPPGNAGQGAFRSLPGGLSELVQAISAALPAAALRLGTPVETVQRGPGAASTWKVITASGEELDAAAVVLATPAFVTGTLVRGFDASLAELCAGVEYASTATVVLAFPRAAVRHPLNGSGFVVPRVEASAILAVSWLSSKWPHRAPAGAVLMRTFVGGARDPHALGEDDDALVARSLAALRPLLGLSGLPLFAQVYRWERASAQHNVGHLTRVERVERALAGHSGLFVTGSGFRGVGIPDCIRDGRATAAQAAETVGHSAPAGSASP